MHKFTLPSIWVGAVLIDIGSALIYRPLGFIVAGAFLLVAGVISATKGKN